MRPDNDPPAAPSLADAVGLARRKPDFLRALSDLLDRAATEAAAAARPCLGGGACCRFDLAGHRLYASTGELALLGLEPPRDAARAAQGQCPYQSGPRCLAHRRRPLGCRLHFCRTPDRAALQGLYESFHRRIRGLHDRHEVPYLYRELTGAIRP